MRAVMVFVVALSGCADEANARHQAVIQTRSASSAEADTGARALEAILDKHPRDKIALLALARHYRARGRITDARVLYERLVATGSRSEEGDRGQEELAQLLSEHPLAPVTPHGTGRPAPVPPVPSASGPAAAPVVLVPGKGFGEIVIGAPRSVVERVLGACSITTGTPDDGVCHHLSRGLEIAFAAGNVRRVSAMRGGRELVLPDGQRRVYAPFVGGTRDGLSVGMLEGDLEARIGRPSTRRRPMIALVAKDESQPLELQDHPARGYTIEIDLTRGGRVVGAVHIPTVEGRSFDTGPYEEKP
jgi:hypothetical protein